MTSGVSRSALLVALGAMLTVLVSGCGSAPASGNVPEARKLLLGAGEIPEDMRLARGQESLGQPRFCGASVVPTTVHDSAFRRYTESAVGPFLYQQVYVSDASDVRAIIRRLSDTLADCSRYTIESDDGERVAFDINRVDRLPTYGQSSIGFGVRPRGADGIPAEYLIIRDGNVLVCFAVIATDRPARDVFRAAATAVTEKLE